MKNLLLITVLLVFSIIAHAQQDVTQFLGIPIDGSKSEMVRKLEKKGFRNVPMTDAFVGEFNGKDVNVFIGTNKGKVWRIAIDYARSTDERSIQITYNNLLSQFTNSKKYMPNYLNFQFPIPDDEDISYEMTVNNKRYDAIFYQRSIAIEEKINSILSSKYSEEQLTNLSEEVQSEIDELKNKFKYDYTKKPVWFRLSSLDGEYHILLFYENEYNQANGEDL